MAKSKTFDLSTVLDTLNTESGYKHKHGLVFHDGSNDGKGRVYSVKGDVGESLDDMLEHFRGSDEDARTKLPEAVLIDGVLSRKSSIAVPLAALANAIDVIQAAKAQAAKA